MKNNINARKDARPCVSNIPKIRFPEFEGEWEKKKLGEIAKFSKGKGISKSDISEDGKNKCIRYGELYTYYNEVIDEVVSKTNVDLKNSIISETNDIIIPASGETQVDIATASCVLDDGIILGGDLNIIKTKHNGIFLSFYLNNNKKIEIARLSQGISVVHLYSRQLALLQVNFPTLPEQRKISNFLTATDKKIQALKKKKSLLEQYKKGIMQKLFHVKADGRTSLRFKPAVSEVKRDNTGKDFPDWEEKKLGEVCECLDNLRKPINSTERQNMKGNIPYWGANNIMDYINDYLFDETIVLLAEDGGNFNEYKDKPIANLSYGKCWVNNHTHVLKGKSNLLNEFLFYSLVHKNITGYVSGGTRAKLIKSEMLKIKINLPYIKEQTKIANFLSATDKKIEKTENKITQTEQWKKGLLQQMFV